MTSLLLSLIVACGPKAPPPPPAAAEVAPAPAPAVEAEPEPAPEPEPPKEVLNANFNATVTSADGTVVTGHVKRVERSADWFGETEWSTAKTDLVVSLDGGSGYKKAPWPDLKTIVIVPGKVPADVDCTYDSNYRPWMYECILKTSGNAVTKDGAKWSVDNRHKWRFTFEDDTSVEFWLKKYPAREQDEGVVDLHSGDPENFALYKKLQQRLREEAEASLVVKVEIN
jgi:hypothetical protein